MPPYTGLQYYNQKFLSLAEHWDEFIMQRTLKNPNIWHDRIPRGAYQLFNGLEQKTNIYRGGLPVQAGLKSWSEIGLSRKAVSGDAGFDNCAMPTPQTYSYAWETVKYSGFQDSWQSEPICLEDMKFQDYAKDQLALIVRTGVDYGISMLENWNREIYVLQAMLSNRGMVMADGALGFEDSASFRFSYDPFLTTADAAGDQVPYIKYPSGLEISTLNWDFLDYLRTNLADRAGEASLAMDSGMPIFGLMIDYLDFERMIKADSNLREDWHYAQPGSLIDGYNMGMKKYRGMALMHDARQMRFRPLRLGAGSNSTDDESGMTIATRVLPLRAGRAATIGNVPEPNPNFYRAEIGLGVIFMNDVVQNLFVPSIDNLGSGMTFGPAPGLTGDWKWINIQDNVNNQLGQSGYFFGRFQIFPKPLLFAHDATVFIYRRCAQALGTACAVQSNSDVTSGAVAVSADAVTADFDSTNRRITLTLAHLIDAGINGAVTIKKADTTTFVAKVAADASAKTYTFVWASGATNAPTAYSDFTAAVSTVTAS